MAALQDLDVLAQSEAYFNRAFPMDAYDPALVPPLPPPLPQQTQESEAPVPSAPPAIHVDEPAASESGAPSEPAAIPVPPLNAQGRKRSRLQVACTECHKRKQSCTGVQEGGCARCIKRKIGAICHVEGYGPGIVPPYAEEQAAKMARRNSPTSPDSPGGNGGDDGLRQRLATLEAFARSLLAQPGASAIVQQQLNPDVLLQVQNALSVGSSARDAATAGASEKGTRDRRDEEQLSAAAALGQLAKAAPAVSPAPAAGPSSLPMTGVNDQSFAYFGAGSVAEMLSAGAGGMSYPSTMIPQTTLPEVLEDLVRAFPDRPTMYLLLETFYEADILNSSFSIAHRPEMDAKSSHIQACREALRLQARGSVIPSLPFAAPYANMALLYILFASTVQFLPLDKRALLADLLEKSQPSLLVEKDIDARIAAYEQRLYGLSRIALHKSEEDEPPTLTAIEAYLTTGCYCKNAGRPTKNYALIAIAVRLGQSLGMHREGAGNWGLGKYEAEKRRRLWWSLYSYDRMSNFLLGRPYVIQEQHCDVSLPYNLDNVDLTLDGPTNVKAANEPSDYLKELIAIDLAKVIGRISDKIYSARKSTYADVLEADKTLADFEANLPLRFRLPNPEDLERYPKLPAHCAGVTMMIHWARASLHRPLLLKQMPEQGGKDMYARSRNLAITLSQQLISAQHHYQMGMSQIRKKYFLVCFMTFDPAATIAMAALNNPSRAAELDPWICEARTLLEAMGQDNLVARQGVACLDALRKKISLIAPPFTQWAMPIREVGGEGTIPIPYLNVATSVGEPVPARQPASDLPAVSYDFDALLKSFNPSPQATMPIDLSWLSKGSADPAQTLSTPPWDFDFGAPSDLSSTVSPNGSDQDAEIAKLLAMPMPKMDWPLFVDDLEGFGGGAAPWMGIVGDGPGGHGSSGML